MGIPQFGCFNSGDEYPDLPTRAPVYGPFSKDPDLVPRTTLDEHLDKIEGAALQLRHTVLQLQQIARELEARRAPK